MSDTKADNKAVNLVETQGVASGEGVQAQTPNTPAARATAQGIVQASADAVLLKYTRCNQCQARLHFSYLTDFSRNMTQETARCPECHHQAHRVMHRLQ